MFLQLSVHIHTLTILKKSQKFSLLKKIKKLNITQWKCSRFKKHKQLFILFKPWYGYFFNWRNLELIWIIFFLNLAKQEQEQTMCHFVALLLFDCYYFVWWKFRINHKCFLESICWQIEQGHRDYLFK